MSWVTEYLLRALEHYRTVATIENPHIIYAIRIHKWRKKLPPAQRIA